MPQPAKPTLTFEYGRSGVVSFTPELSPRFLRKAVDYFRKRLAWKLTGRSFPAEMLGNGGIENGAWVLAYELQNEILQSIIRAYAATGEISNSDIDDLLSKTLGEFEGKFFSADGEGVGAEYLCGKEPDRRPWEESAKDALANAWQ